MSEVTNAKDPQPSDLHRPLASSSAWTEDGSRPQEVERGSQSHAGTPTAPGPYPPPRGGAAPRQGGFSCCGRRGSCCCCCSRRGDRGAPFFRNNREARAWCLDVTGRTTAVLSLGAFLMPALLQLARVSAGCEPDDRACDSPTPYGVKPGSWLAVTQTAVSVLASPLLPVMGAVVDHTPHRLAVGRFLSALFCCLLFPMIFVGQQTWFAVSLLVVVAFLTFEFQMVTAYSYLPELTPDERELRDFTRNFTTAAFCFAVAYVAVIVGVSGGLHRASDAVWVAKLSMSLTFVVAALFLGMAWLRGFKPRPPLRRLSDEGGAPRSVWTAGFVKLGGSIKLLASTPQYRPLLWFNLAIAFCDAALQSLPTILITLLSDQLGFTSAEIGASVLVLLLAIAPAGFLSAYATKRLGNDAVRSSLLALLVLAATTAAAAIVLTPDAGPAQAYALVAFWGVGNGWKWTCDRLASGTLCPPSQSGEFMGLYLFSTIVLTWLPPLVFTILNESGAGMRVGLATLDVWFVLSASMYLCMGSYRDAVASMASAVPPSPPSSSLDRGDQEEDDDECALPPPPEEAPPPAEADAVTDMVEIELTETSPAK